MSTESNAVVITGAWQGIRAALIKAYRDRDHRVIAGCRSSGVGLHCR
jgi:NAD(P)-dependent dehydrogenase (short-subunit alcohol dehydrogenase family)